MYDYFSVCMYVCECMSCVSGLFQRPNEDVESSRARVTGNCKPLE